MNLARRDKLFLLYEKAKLDAQNEFKSLITKRLFITALAIYWGEGDRKSEGNVRISNVDPRMIALFLDFLTVIMKVPREKIWVSLLIYPHIGVSFAESFWSKYLNLPLSNFQKTVIIKARDSQKALQNTQGVCSLGVSSKFLKEKMKVWLELFSQRER